MAEGWIKLHRKILDWEWFTCKHMFKLFSYLLLKASHNDFNFRGKLIERGQLPFGYHSASLETKISVQSLRTCVKRLISTNEITIETTSQGSIITILNYSQYQESTNESTIDQQSINNQSTTTKKIKKIKKNIYRSIFDLDAAYKKYPRKIGKKKGLEICQRVIKSEVDYNNLLKAVDNYCDFLKANSTDEKYIKHFSTFMRSWDEWIDYETLNLLGTSKGLVNIEGQKVWQFMCGANHLKLNSDEMSYVKDNGGAFRAGENQDFAKVNRIKKELGIL